MSRSPRHSGRKRHHKTQASQGDAVLIGFLSGQNLPDVARRAGEEPLNSSSQSEGGDMGEDTEEGLGVDMGGEAEKFSGKNNHLVQTAQDALSVDGHEDRNSAPPLESGKRVRPKIQTQSLGPDLGDQDSNRRNTSPPSKATVKAKPVNLPANNAKDATNHQDQRQRTSPSENQGSSPLATSPRLRHFMTSKG
ncbi:MAG: hypothetical protein Q9167_001966, partial [Letrouitia subvulpina]